MRTAALCIAILVGAAIIAGAIVAKPTGFAHCVTIITAEIERQGMATAATLDPRDVEVEAARVCAGAT